MFLIRASVPCYHYYKSYKHNIQMFQNTKFKQAQYRENQIGTEFLSCPDDDVTRVYIAGQIASAENFPESELYHHLYIVSIPLGWKPEVNEEYKALDLSQQQIKQLNCLQSVTQSALPILQKNKDGGVITKFYFSFPVDIQLLMKNNSTQWPIIHFQVFSRDNWERIRMLGCGFVKIPKDPGFYNLSTETWKPIVDHKTRVLQYFLGGIIKTKNLQDIAKQEHVNDSDEPGPINRYNYHGMSSGKINVRLNVVIQSKAVKTEERVVYRDQKYSQQTQIKKKQLSQNIPSLVNTGKVLGSRLTNVKLQ